MSFTKDELRQLDRLNKKKVVWDNAGVSNMAIENVNNMLENFYEGLAAEGYIIKGSIDRFTMRSDLTEAQQKQLLDIANYMENDKTASMSYYNKRLSPTAQKAFEKAKEKGYVTGDGKQAFIDFVDFMNNAQAVKEAVEMLGSKTIARIYGYGKTKGLTAQEINELILSNYNDFSNGDQLQTFIFNEIDMEYEKRNK